MQQLKETPTSKKSISMRKLVYGVGINDADYLTQPMINGKQITCPFYKRWQDMLKRCYSSKCHEKYPTYIGCTVCEEWLLFSNFKSWMEKQNWEENHLDKDLKIKGNKIYSPDACMFVSQAINAFTTGADAIRGKYPIGVSFNKHAGKFQAECSNGKGKSKHLGLFSTQEDAHQAWKVYKKKLGLELANEQSDPEIKAALIQYVDSI